MALTSSRSANSVYIEGSGGAGTADSVTVKNTLVTGIILTAGASAETLTLRDVTTTTIKVVIKAAAGTTFQTSDFPEMLFPNGVRATLTQTDSHVTLIVKESRA